MLPTRQRSFHLFRFAGINVYVHWSWFVIAIYEINTRRGEYSSVAWNVLEYASLFAIVLMHEFGHALACRSVGGKAEQIVLWPLGGVAYVAPPQRPGATLWSLAAGPLVNVVLAPVLTALVFLGSASGWAESLPNAYHFIRSICLMNYILLVFNLIPVYPLDGGQIVRSLLWFFLGRARSLMIATMIGFVGVAGLVLFAVMAHDIWLAVICAFIFMNCWGGLLQARMLARADKLPRRAGFACPSCRQPPIVGPYWRCARCSSNFDTFESQTVCPHCGAQFPITQCLDCGTAQPMSNWVLPATPSGESMPPRP